MSSISNIEQSSIVRLSKLAAFVAASVAIITISAKTTVPFFPVPMTMQVAAILLVASIGGVRMGVTAVAAYTVAGALGYPVFAGTPEKGIGLAYMMGPTGGYLAGFMVAAVIVAWASDQFGKKAAALAMPLGLAVIYALGLAWLARFVPSDKLLAYGMTPFLLGDIVKVALAAALTFVAPKAVTNWLKN